jgi:6-pyruvoyltetrahydropterin/6-carboxytetrahydropterin synthase
MFGLTVRSHMMIAHSLPDPVFGPAQGLHGATLVVEATFRRAELTAQAVVMDIGRAQALLDEVLDALRYRNLDEHPDFTGTLTTTEMLARHVAERLADGLRAEPGGTHGYAALGVVLREHPDAWASYVLHLDPPGSR